MTTKEITGQFMIDWCVAHNQVAWLKETSAKDHKFVRLRSEFINKFDEFKELRPKKKATAEPLWKQIEKL